MAQIHLQEWRKAQIEMVEVKGGQTVEMLVRVFGRGGSGWLTALGFGELLDLRESPSDFLTVATDTTAIAIEWALAELVNNPTVLKKAQEEIDQVVGRQRLVQESDGPNLPYIHHKGNNAASPTHPHDY
ncbi:hypothetical protein RJ640_015530 [Escallonia rubra]|uniref:Cytochrome P450 n=1 Tax=Escallonia rubra TaxID=112253 RepID=A0AA88S0H2_9ASTE|nr:hypothetical protein RJ640_015530 [Escallonia rubra]